MKFIYLFLITIIFNLVSVLPAFSGGITPPTPNIPPTPRVYHLKLTPVPESYDGNYDIEWNLLPGKKWYTVYENNNYLYGGEGNKVTIKSKPTGRYSYTVQTDGGLDYLSRPMNVDVNRKALDGQALDDGTIGNIDNDDNGIRDDIEVIISQLSATNSLQEGYLKHTAFYTRAFLLATTKVDKKRFFSEVLKGKSCLSTAHNNDAYATLMGNHLDSKDRFNRYLQNSKDVNLNEELFNDNNMCVLKGLGVEPVSGCFEENHHGNIASIWNLTNPLFREGHVWGENVKMSLNIRNIPHDGNDFDFSVYLGGVLQERKTVTEGSSASWFIENYIFEDDGYLVIQVEKAPGAIHVVWDITCESNQ